MWLPPLQLRQWQQRRSNKGRSLPRATKPRPTLDRATDSHNHVKVVAASPMGTGSCRALLDLTNHTGHVAINEQRSHFACVAPVRCPCFLPATNSRSHLR